MSFYAQSIYIYGFYILKIHNVFVLHGIKFKKISSLIYGSENRYMSNLNY